MKLFEGIETSYTPCKMNFGSKFVYEYPDSEEECVSDDEFETGMTRELSRWVKMKMKF